MTGPGHTRLDRIDLRILAALQENARITNVALAEAAGLTPSPCLQRVRRLERAGIIERYGALLRLARIGPHVTVFTEVTLSDHRREDFIRFEREIVRCPFVEDCHLVSGGYDYLLRFTARSVSHYQEVIEGLLSRNVGIEKYFSYVVIKPLIDRRPVPLQSLLGDDGAQG